jgi:hypothetical protein
MWRALVVPKHRLTVRRIPSVLCRLPLFVLLLRAFMDDVPRVLSSRVSRAGQEPLRHAEPGRAAMSRGSLRGTDRSAAQMYRRLAATWAADRTGTSVVGTRAGHDQSNKDEGARDGEYGECSQVRVVAAPTWGSVLNSNHPEQRWHLHRNA